MRFAESRMRFGIFMGPYHRPDQNPLLSFQRDMETVVNLDRLGFDEAWIGEHHSGGIETIASPELFIAAAAERTKRIKLGTGAITLPYHHPFHVADRIVQLDYMTRGRVMLGVAPGQLVRDAQQLGIDPMDSRRRLQESLDVLIPLLKGETVTKKTDWFELKEASLQLLPYSDFDIAAVGAISPSGPAVAGKYGLSYISVAATNPVGVEKLLEHWHLLEVEAAKHGHSVSRENWRLMGPMHLAPSLEEAKRDVRHGMTFFQEYLDHVNPGAGMNWADLDAAVDIMNDTGAAIIGTPEMARNQITRLQQKSGGFGTYLLMGIDWADFPATMQSHELFAEQVIPYFNGTGASLQKSFNDVMKTGYEGAEITRAAQEAMADRYKRQG